MPAVAERLPWTLRAYRGLASLATPLAGIVLARRLKRGKEHPARLAERRGEAKIARPPGPLIWAHGASVGEMLAVIPLVEALRNRIERENAHDPAPTPDPRHRQDPRHSVL